jgi:Inhibitor of vertebrate lysozyme (Ivy)
MQAAFLFALLLALNGVPAFAAGAPKAPYLSDLMKQPAHRAAWYGMLAGETAPSWVEDYAKTLDGPPTPSIAVEADDETYTLAFTCKANACSDNQLFVLFSPGGAKAWGLLLTGGEKKWLGAPDERIQKAILSGIE